MFFQNYHTHCNLCDGNDLLDDIVYEAIKKNIKILGLSSHAPLPFYQDWVLKKENLPIYLNKIDILKEQNREKIILKKGLEVDFIPGISYPQTFKEIFKLDYVIGSVHFIIFDEYKYLTVDGDYNDFIIILKEGFKNNIKLMIEYYYFLIQQMCTENSLDIVGHFDLIKKNNRNNLFFDDKEKWYLQIVENTLIKIKNKSKTNPIFEINTGGMARGYLKEPYPSFEILKLLKKYDFNITINSDCHSKENLLYCFNDMTKLAKDAGFKYLMKLNDNNEWESFSID